MSKLPVVKVSITPVDKFREYLATRGKRLTQERAFIVEEVFAHHEHFDAEELVERLTNRKDSKRVSRATVYRTLNGLQEAGLLRKVARTNDRDVYEHDYGYPEHDHLICTKCGMLIEFSNQKIRELLEEITQEHHFLMDHHRLEVQGLCKECSRPSRRPSKLDMI
ncbi:Ferric uptake regulation protein FUR [hydrothermal vent metagenome]|uniref:Ferric uptake regulation protein FUR n=1 Tax=hydrothermal vent metagenome TaxID=652676 RepID=A0A3B1D8U9_9ZZZZ